MNTQPISTALGDLFHWESQQTIPSNVVGSNRVSDRLQVQADSWFVLMAFLGTTNYDDVAGDFIATIGAGPAAARTLVPTPFVPNNFEVLIRFNSDLALMDTPVPQACICSNATRSGPQMAIPMLCPPMSTFDFEFYNVAPTLLTQADRSTAIDLQLTFGLYGYFVKTPMLGAFLQCYEPYKLQAQNALAGWISRFTNLPELNGITGL